MNVKHRMAILGVVAVAAGSISACGGGDSGQAAAVAPPPASVTSQSLDTMQVLAQARQPSETASPYPVNGGALVLTDTSDTTEPVNINGS
jgi:hypothetical protein